MRVTPLLTYLFRIQTDARGHLMNKVKSIIREFEKEKDSLKKLVLVDSIQNELEKTKKELARKVR